jgi:hypothetical protein
LTGAFFFLPDASTMISQEMQGVIGVHIEQTSGVRSGKPRIK